MKAKCNLAHPSHADRALLGVGLAVLESPRGYQRREHCLHAGFIPQTPEVAS